MAWMSDERYVLMQDTKEKKITARGARHTRTHCGKSGRVRLPSDNLSKKELKAMSGECKSYRLNKPMSLDEFKDLPDDLKINYIKLIRNRWNAPDIEIAKMMGVSNYTVSAYFDGLGLRQGKNGRKRTWDEEGFRAWVNGEDVSDIQESDEPVVSEDPPAPEPTICTLHHMPVIPKSGTMTFEHNFTDDALDTIRCLLSNVRANVTISWECVNEDETHQGE